MRTRRKKRGAIQRFLESDSIARSFAKKKKALQRKAKRTFKRAKKLGVKSIKRTKRIAKRSNRKAASLLKKAKRTYRRVSKVSLRKLKRATKISKRAFKKLSKPYQLRGKKLRQRRQEARIRLSGRIDLSKANIVQATGDTGASRPGEPPKMRSGKGRSAIQAELRKRGSQVVGRTFVDKKIAPYMAIWEFRQDDQQRPFLKPGLENNMSTFRTTVGAELKRAVTAVPKRKAVVK